LLALQCVKGQYAVVGVSEGVPDLVLGVLAGDGSGWVAACTVVRPDPEVKFEASKAGLYVVFVRNPTDKHALVSLTRLKK
jgi:hypothetical protein